MILWFIVFFSDVIVIGSGFSLWLISVLVSVLNIVVLVVC